jgi:hypothetical protein
MSPETVGHKFFTDLCQEMFCFLADAENAKIPIREASWYLAEDLFAD